jgi:CrcB protein
LVGVGGFIGSVVRYWVGGVAQRLVTTGFPLGTFVVNVLGCLLIGAFFYLVEARGWFRPEMRVFCTVGVLGGFTTFSAFGYETFALVRDSQYLQAVTNITANGFAGLAAVMIGWLVAKLLMFDWLA